VHVLYSEFLLALFEVEKREYSITLYHNLKIILVIGNKGEERSSYGVFQTRKPSWNMNFSKVNAIKTFDHGVFHFEHQHI
jgi:hypothetical protein